MPRPPAALPVLPVPHGPDPLLSASEAAGQIGISESRYWRYAQRFPLLVSGRRITEATKGAKGRTKWIQSYVTAHIHTEMRRARDEDTVAAPSPRTPREPRRALERVA